MDNSTRINAGGMFHPTHHHHHRGHVIMSPEDVASGRKPDPWSGLEITGSVRNLSPALWNMTHITSLYLNDNCLTRLPPDIGRLTHLRQLDLSSNKLRVLPRELGDLIHLEELLLDNNQLKSLPLEMGKLFHLRRLGLKGNASLNQELLQIYQEPKGTQKLITHLLDHLAAQYPAPRPPQRPWVLMDQPVDRTKPSCMFTTMCYNVLCDKYATRQLYGYCPAWALSWDYRKHSILEELKAYSADIIALQEVETEQYHDYFARELQAEGYEGIFSPKSRAKTMSEFDRKHVDGCAIFYKTSKFSLIKEHLIEFNQLAMANAEGSDDMLNRVMTKDNIALVALLQIKEGAFDSLQPGVGSGNGTANSGSVNSTNNPTINISAQPLHQQRLLVCTAHIHWDPEFCDVKIIQTIMLTHELQAIANQAAKDLLINSNQDINAVKNFYLKNESSDEGGGGTSHTVVNKPLNGPDSSLDGEHETDDSKQENDNDENAHSDRLGPEIIPIILCGDFNSHPDSSVVEFLSNGVISADHRDFKKLAYKDCLRKICNSRSSALAHSQPLQQSQCNQFGLESSYTHPFPVATAYTGQGTMPYTNYTFDFKGVIDYIFYSKNLMSVLGVSGLDKTWLVENKIPGLPHPYFPSDHFPLYVELELLPSPRTNPLNRHKHQQNHLQHNNDALISQHNRTTDFLQNPMKKPFFGT